MTASITLTVDVPADAGRVFDVLSTTEGQRAFWTADCDVTAGRARFGFPEAPVDLLVEVTAEERTRVRMRVTDGFPFWVGSTWEWEMVPAAAQAGTVVLFRHSGFGAGYPDVELGRVAMTWARIHDRLAGFLTDGTPQPFFPAVRA